jgi:hypothetical protein
VVKGLIDGGGGELGDNAGGELGDNAGGELVVAPHPATSRAASRAASRPGGPGRRRRSYMVPRRYLAATGSGDLRRGEPIRTAVEPSGLLPHHGEVEVS